MATFDKYGKEMHDLTEANVGKRAAYTTWLLVWIATLCACLTVIVGSVFLGMTYVLPYVSKIPRLPLPEMGNVALSFAIAVAVVGVAAVWLLKTFRRTRDAVVSIVATRLDEMNVEIQSVSGRITDVAGLFGGTADRVHHLESHAASLATANDAFDEIHRRLVSLEPVSPNLRGQTEMFRDILLRMMNGVSVKSVGHPLRIDSAVYRAVGGKEIDVTTIVERNVKDNRVRMPVNSRTMGNDPQHGLNKVLHVRYTVDHVTREVEVTEDEELKIP